MLVAKALCQLHINARYYITTSDSMNSQKALTIPPSSPTGTIAKSIALIEQERVRHHDICQGDGYVSQSATLGTFTLLYFQLILVSRPPSTHKI